MTAAAETDEPAEPVEPDESDEPDDLPDGVTAALLVACALAWHGNPLAPVAGYGLRARRLVACARSSYRDAELLDWPAHVAPALHTMRWDFACAVVRAHHRELPGAADLPDFHDSLFTVDRR